MIELFDVDKNSVIIIHVNINDLNTKQIKELFDYNRKSFNDIFPDNKVIVLPDNVKVSIVNKTLY